jgi:hypothetical protein
VRAFVSAVAFLLPALVAVSARADPTVAGSGASAPMVFVHVESDHDVMLEREHDGTWEGVCMGSCDTEVPVGVKLRVSGSEPFVLHGVAGRGVTLHVRSGSHTGVAAGGVLIGLGSVAVILAPFVYFPAGGCFIFCNGSDNTGPIAAVVGLFAGGVALIVLGAALVAYETVPHVEGRGVVPAPELRAPKEEQLPTVSYPHDEGRTPAPALPVLRVTF